MSGIYTVVSGAVAEEKRLGFISNNLANALTAGYKSSRPVFEAVLSSSIIDTDKADSTFVGTYDSQIDFAEGALIESGNKLDVALQGDGFFVIQTAQGDRYTRNGQFTLDATGKLVTQDGNTVAGEGGDIIANGKEIAIASDGSVLVDKASVGRLKIVRFATKENLRPVGSSLFENVNPLDQELPTVNCTVNQGYHEGSNVDVLKEMIDMIACTRAYEAYGKVQQAFGDMDSQLQEVAKV
ncbi:MAG TPA: flagellar basal-body rod protein FlgF [Syntrophorhabdales bacterium]|nr:flagellar basal-body rod protein FlgF [Syntrophorhabdales bacterium]